MTIKVGHDTMCKLTDVEQGRRALEASRVVQRAPRLIPHRCGDTKIKSGRAHCKGLADEPRAHRHDVHDIAREHVVNENIRTVGGWVGWVGLFVNSRLHGTRTKLKNAYDFFQQQKNAVGRRIVWARGEG